MTFDQHESDVRFEWGEQGVATLALISDAVIIVDVLSFSTSVEIAVNRGAMVFPYPWHHDTAAEYAISVGAELADPRRSKGKPSLSPESLLTLPTGTRLVLPSPNGATLTLAAKSKPVLAGCLRNAQVVALAARQYDRRIAVIDAGERWKDDHSLRPALEDLVGAGAIITYLTGRLSPEALSAVVAFREIKSKLSESLLQCGSGKELIAQGYEQDVNLASQLDVSRCAPILVNGAYVRAEGRDWIKQP